MSVSDHRRAATPRRLFDGVQAATTDAPPFNVCLYHDGANAATNATTDARQANATTDNKPTRHAAALRPPPKKIFFLACHKPRLFSRYKCKAKQTRHASGTETEEQPPRETRHAKEDAQATQTARANVERQTPRKAAAANAKKFCATCHKRQKFFRYKCKAKRKRKRKA